MFKVFKILKRKQHPLYYFHTINNTRQKYKPGDFSFIPSENERVRLQKAYNLIHDNNLWLFLYDFKPPEKHGYMFWQHRNLSFLYNSLIDVKVDGLNFGSVIRQMKCISCFGWDRYVNQRLEYLNNLSSSIN